MGALISSFFQTGGHLLSSGTSDGTRRVVLALLEEMRSQESSHIHWSTIESFIVQIPKVSDRKCPRGESALDVIWDSHKLRC